jgi:hypothetical protein
VNRIRQRTKDNLPTVLLTLLSIVQALALELLWSYIRESDYLFVFSWAILVYWLQVVVTLMGLILIWIIYASAAIRFRWVPSTSDSIYPFVIGLLQFMLIAALGPDKMGWWFILLAAVFGLMHWISHQTMRRARHDGENDEFFGRYEPARRRDFIPTIVTVTATAVFGVYLLLGSFEVIPVAIALLILISTLAWQFAQTARFWNQSVSDEV